MLPCFDQPNIKASFELSVVAPASWHVIANEKATSATKGTGSGALSETRLHLFAKTPRISTCELVFCSSALLLPANCLNSRSGLRSVLVVACLLDPSPSHGQCVHVLADLFAVIAGPFAEYKDNSFDNGRIPCGRPLTSLCCSGTSLCAAGRCALPVSRCVALSPLPIAHH